jgi:hypothetical protein
LTSKTLCDFLGGFDPASLQGAIVFVSLDRVLDNLIRTALALGDYHRGKPGIWSHVFLIVEPYRGPETEIAECTVRHPTGGLIWDEDGHLDPLEVLASKNVLSGICFGRVSDYDDRRVTRWGVKYLPRLAVTQRERIVMAATDPKWASYRYDFPGLLRSLIRLITGDVISPPAGKNLLFCSAFVQHVYVDALGDAGRFTKWINDDDATPDDLWYPNIGLAIGPASRKA